MFSKINNITIKVNEPLGNHCSFKVGGNAKYFIVAHTVDALLDCLETCKRHSIPHKLIGGGSNILFDDLGYNGAIIKYDENTKLIKNGLLQASSGCSLNELIQFCKSCNLGGFEFCVGVPAMLGGAIVNNLGAYSQEISAYIQHVTILQNNKIKYLTNRDCKFKYHSSALQSQKLIVLGATFNLPLQNSQTTQTKMLQYFEKRKNSQPLNLPNAGSIFKRSENVIPAKLIDECGLKGTTIGGAQISTKHAGFIVNVENAKSKDIINLINLIKIKIYEKYSINLINEIEYISYL